MKRAFALLPLLIGACSDGRQASRAGANRAGVTPNVASARTPSDIYFCGGETDLATVRLYFADLAQALAQPGSTSRFNRFVRARFGVTDDRGETLYFNAKDVDSITPTRITIPEWREIQRRGERSLLSAGYRGCFMDHGKVWFEASEKGFRLMGIAKNMPWVPLPESDVVR